MKKHHLFVGIRNSSSTRAIAYATMTAFAITSCTAIPTIDSNWISENCISVGNFTTDVANYSNCDRNTDGTVTCTYDGGGQWKGKLLIGKKHGLGQYNWPDGTSFIGEMNNDSKWCGVESNGSTFYVYRNGEYEQGQAGVDWETVGVALLVIGVIGVVAAAAADGGGGGYYPTTDNDWDWDAFYDQYYNIQWRCRGIQTGQFAVDENCAYDTKDDDRWPEK